jgi:hypothetical protein
LQWDFHTSTRYAAQTVMPTVSAIARAPTIGETVLDTVEWMVWQARVDRRARTGIADII